MIQQRPPNKDKTGRIAPPNPDATVRIDPLAPLGKDGTIRIPPLGASPPAEPRRGPRGNPQTRHQALERYTTIFSPLVEKGYIGNDLLAAVVAEAYDEERSAATILIERHQIPKAAVGDAMSSFYKCQFVEYDEKFPVSRSLVTTISAQYLRANFWFPLWQDGTTLHVVIDDPHSSQKIQDIQHIFPGQALRFYVGLRADILRFIEAAMRADAPVAQPDAPVDAILSILENDKKLDESVIEKTKTVETVVSEGDGAVVRLVNQFIVDAQKAGASDIHIEPYPDKELIVRFRIDGECRIYQKIPAHYRHAIAARVKIMAGLDIAERRKPQDGKISVHLPEAKRNLELRVATLPTVDDNEDVVLRLLAAQEPAPIDKLGLTVENLRALREILEAPYGLFLCAGPTGSGKTTTLHSALGYLNGPDMKIWTAEDPVEITQYGLRQVAMQAKIGLTFASALRAFLRADPDVVMIGEMRDQETIEIAVQAALTGHLVLSTLHTNSSAETVTRLLDMGADPFSYADSLLGVLAQRLVRRVCEGCREAYHPKQEEFDALAHAYGEAAFAKLGFEYGDDFTLYKGKGCEACGGSGYKGRVGIHELLVVQDDVRRLVRAKSPAAEVMRCGREHGLRTLVQDGVVKCLKGITDFSQVKAVAK